MGQITKAVIYNSGNANKDITISVTIGYAQLSVSSIYVDGKKMGGEFKDSFDLTIGNAGDLRGKEVVCFTTVSDIQPDTNETSVKVKVRGANGVLDIPTLRLKANDGEVVFYKINITII